MDIRNRFLRAEEEMSITDCEMLSVLHTFSGEYDILMSYIHTNSSEKPGMTLAVKEKASKMKEKYFRCHRRFSRHISTPPIPPHLTSSWSTDNEEEAEPLESDSSDEDSDEES